MNGRTQPCSVSTLSPHPRRNGRSFFFFKSIRTTLAILLTLLPISSIAITQLAFAQSTDNTELSDQQQANLKRIRDQQAKLRQQIQRASDNPDYQRSLQNKYDNLETRAQVIKNPDYVPDQLPPTPSARQQAQAEVEAARTAERQARATNAAAEREVSTANSNVANKQNALEKAMGHQNTANENYNKTQPGTPEEISAASKVEVRSRLANEANTNFNKSLVNREQTEAQAEATRQQLAQKKKELFGAVAEKKNTSEFSRLSSLDEAVNHPDSKVVPASSTRVTTPVQPAVKSIASTESDPQAPSAPPLGNYQPPKPVEIKINKSESAGQAPQVDLMAELRNKLGARRGGLSEEAETPKPTQAKITSAPYRLTPERNQPTEINKPGVVPDAPPPPSADLFKKYQISKGERTDTSAGALSGPRKDKAFQEELNARVSSRANESSAGLSIDEKLAARKSTQSGGLNIAENPILKQRADAFRNADGRTDTDPFDTPEAHTTNLRSNLKPTSTQTNTSTVTSEGSPSNPFGSKVNFNKPVVQGAAPVVTENSASPFGSKVNFNKPVVQGAAPVVTENSASPFGSKVNFNKPVVQGAAPVVTENSASPFGSKVNFNKPVVQGEAPVVTENSASPFGSKVNFNKPVVQGEAPVVTENSASPFGSKVNFNKPVVQGEAPVVTENSASPFGSKVNFSKPVVQGAAPVVTENSASPFGSKVNFNKPVVQGAAPVVTENSASPFGSKVNFNKPVVQGEAPVVTENSASPFGSKVNFSKPVVQGAAPVVTENSASPFGSKVNFSKPVVQGEAPVVTENSASPFGSKVNFSKPVVQGEAPVVTENSASPFGSKVNFSKPVVQGAAPVVTENSASPFGSKVNFSKPVVQGEAPAVPASTSQNSSLFDELKAKLGTKDFGLKTPERPIDPVPENQLHPSTQGTSAFETKLKERLNTITTGPDGKVNYGLNKTDGPKTPTLGETFSELKVNSGGIIKPTVINETVATPASVLGSPVTAPAAAAGAAAPTTVVNNITNNYHGPVNMGSGTQTTQAGGAPIANSAGTPAGAVAATTGSNDATYVRTAPEFSRDEKIGRFKFNSTAKSLESQLTNGVDASSERVPSGGSGLAGGSGGGGFSPPPTPPTGTTPAAGGGAAGLPPPQMTVTASTTVTGDNAPAPPPGPPPSSYANPNPNPAATANATTAAAGAADAKAGLKDNNVERSADRYAFRDHVDSSDACAVSGTLDEKAKCSATHERVQSTQMIGMMMGMAGNTLTQTMGQQAVTNTANSTTDQQKAALQQAGKLQASTAVTQGGLAAANLTMGGLLLNMGRKHTNNAKNFDSLMNASAGVTALDIGNGKNNATNLTPTNKSDAGYIFSNDAMTQTAIDKFRLNHEGKKVKFTKIENGDLKNPETEQLAANRIKEGREALSDARSEIKKIGGAASAEQKAAATAARMGALMPMVQAMTQLASASMAAKNAYDLLNQKVPDSASNAAPSFAGISAATDNTTDSSSGSAGAISGAGSDPNAQPTEDAPGNTAGNMDLGQGINPIPLPSGVGNGQAGGFNAGLPAAGAGSGGGSGGGGGGSTNAATGSSEDPQAKLAANGGNQAGYDSGGAFSGGGGGGGKGADAGPDLSSLLGQFLPHKEDADARPASLLDYGSAAQGEQPFSVLDKNANIFQRIHDTYQDKQKHSVVGG